MDGVYTQTNEAERNEVVAFRRAADGRLAPVGRYETGGKGTGKPHLPSQSSLALSGDGRWLLVANSGSDDLSVFAVAEEGLSLSDRVHSGGTAPMSVAEHDGLVYVLNTGGESPNITGFRIDADGRASMLDGSTRPLSSDAADPAQIQFSPDGTALVATERGTDSISTYAIGPDGYAEGPVTIPSKGATPYGFDFRGDGALVVTEAFGGEVGAAAASSYLLGGSQLEAVSGSVRNTRSEVCWAVVGKDGRYAYVTNFGDGTVSRYALADDGALELVDPVAASTTPGEKGVRDESLTPDGRFLYAIDADAQKVFGWRVQEDGTLSSVGDFDGLPATVAGLAAG